MLGGPLLGVLFARAALTPASIAKTAVFSIGILLGAIHIFSLNDWLGYPREKYNPRKRSMPLMCGKINLRQMRVLCLTSGLFSLLLLAAVSFRVFAGAILIIILGILHDHPRLLLKGKPFIDILVNAFGGALLFLLGYTLFSSLDRRGALISVYFAILVAAGYLNHPLEDYEADMKLGIRTTAVILGKEKTAQLSFLLFTISVIYFCALSFKGIIPGQFLTLGLIIYVIYVYLFYSLHRAGLKSQNLGKFIVRYRSLYAAKGLWMAVYLVLI